MSFSSAKPNGWCSELKQMRKTQTDKPLWSLMKSDSQMQAELIKPDRCRLQLIPLVDSNPVMKAGRLSLWQLYLRPEGGHTPLNCCHCNSWVQTGLFWIPSICAPLRLPSNEDLLYSSNPLTCKCQPAHPPPQHALLDDTKHHHFV